jgi:hypothetical protein
VRKTAMRSNTFKSILIKSGLAASILLLASGAAVAQQQVNLTAAAATATLPDGTVVPMWGYSCGTAVTSSTATCAGLNKPATAAVWSPIIITVPTGQDLQINLTNNLPTPAGATTGIPTSLTIVGQLGGGLGTGATTAASPPHAGLGVSWPVAGPPSDGSGATPSGTAPTFTPPPQAPRVQSFATEVVKGTTTTLCWGVCGGTSPSLALRPGTYLIESGTHPSIQGPMGLYGILVVTQAPTSSGTAPATTETAAGIAYPGVAYDAEVPLLLSEIDPVQNAAVYAAINTTGFSEYTVWSGQPGGCGNVSSPTYNTCYPPAVNYTPLYYLFNGVAFNKTNPTLSLFPLTPATLAPAAGPGSVLVRLVNAGLRMHVPAIVGSQTSPPVSTGALPPAVAPTGFSLIAEDGNVAPGLPKVQSEVFMAPGKTFDVMINGQAAGAPALAVYDRELSLSANGIGRDAGMLAYVGATLPTGVATSATAVARADTYNSLVAGQTLTVSDPSKGLIANDSNVYGVQLAAPVAANGTVTLNANGTFTYVPNGTATSDSFGYCANGTTTICTTVTLGAAKIEAGSGITMANIAYTSNVATFITIAPPGILSVDKDGAGYPLSVSNPSGVAASGCTLVLDANGGFNATSPGPGTCTFTYSAQNSQGTVSATTAKVTLTFPTGSGLNVSVVDGKTGFAIAQDYRWIIEEDQTFFVDPKCASNPPPAGCPGGAGGPVTSGNSGAGAVLPTFGTNFHTSHMPFVAQGCTGPYSCEAGQTVYDPVSKTHVSAVCDVGNGACRPGSQRAQSLPSAVLLDPKKRYYISVLPGDAANPFAAGYAGQPCLATNATDSANPPDPTCIGHGMGGAPIAAGQTSVKVISQAAPYTPGQLSVYVFEDDFPLNGEIDVGGGVDVLAPNEPGLGGFQIHLWDPMGGNGDFTGQMSYDMFNMPLTNSLDGTLDPLTGNDACPITKLGLAAVAAGTQASGITGMIVTCPKYESDGVTLSALAGEVIVNNLMQGRFEIIATPGADRIARGEEWLQTNTLDGQKAHDTFIRIGEPSFFQEFGPSGYHATIGFANPKIINGRKAGVCAGTDINETGVQNGTCTYSVTGHVTTERMSRTPDERLYGSGSHDSFYWTNCYVSFGDPDGEDFAFTKCAADGSFTLTGLPPGSWRVTVFDQWNDMLVDGLSTPVLLGGIPAGSGLAANSPSVACPGKATTSSLCDMGEIATNQWQVNLYTRTFVDDNEDGVSQSSEAGIPLLNTTVRYRDGSLGNNLQTDFTGVANFNETFPLFNWYVVETDTTRYKNTGTHAVYDAGGPADGTTACGVAGYPPCGNSVIGKFMANTAEQISVPVALRVPGAVYCANADCTGYSIANGPGSSAPPTVVSGTPAVAQPPYLSTGRIDPPWLAGTEGWMSFSGQNNWLEFGKALYSVGENGGIKGHVIYASTRPFDDPQMLVQTQWEPLVPGVTINLYQEGTAADGITPVLTLVDSTQTSSWDKWAQGFRTAADGTTVVTAGSGTAAGAVPNMSCPGQATTDLFYFTLFDQPNYLDLYNNVLHGTAAAPTALAYNSQYKCYDSMHNWNQLQPAPYDGMYAFPSVTAMDPATGKPSKTNCTICVANPATDMYAGLPMLPVGKYVVEVVVPPGYELVKEEDKNILIGDNYIAPAVNEFGGLGDIFIMPDQASVSSAYNANNAQNSTNSLGAVPNNGIVPGFTPEPTWPCVGQARIVPDYMSIYPQAQQVAAFAGATRNLCDRKEVTLGEQTNAIAKFYVFTSTHIASKFTGVITDDFTSEFDPFSPQFGEKFSPPNMPVSFKDWTGTEISRVYSDQWGTFDGLTYSTWEVNPPNPTGYSPTMMVTCMNDPGPFLDTTLGSPTYGTMIKDVLFNPAYSQFCYELPFMPGQTTYMDTPVIPTSAFAGAGYNNPDCDYPANTPAIKEVDGDGVGPWVSAAGHHLTITALGDTQVFNYGYSGPAATTAPFNQKQVTRHYGFGATQGTGSVAIGGISAPVTSWSDLAITVTVPNGVPACAIQQQAQYVPAGTTTAQCGELSITAAGGQQSIDTVTVTIGGKAPLRVPTNQPTVQAAINAAAPGDLIMVGPGTYSELLIMWKPVRLQGVGAASSVLKAVVQFGQLSTWRQQVNCYFGLALNGQPANAGGTLTFSDGSPSIKTNPYDSTNTVSCPVAGTNYFVGGPNSPQIDRIPLEGIVGWDTTLNGNLAELLQEPTLMGAYEGAGITVLGKGVRYPGPATINPVTHAPYAATNVFGVATDTEANSSIAHEGQFPVPTVLLTNSSADCGEGTAPGTRRDPYVANPFPSSFHCNPSRIDGLSITDSSQGGGGVFVHGWADSLEIANNRIYNNTGTLTGGIVIGQGESPDGLLSGNSGDPIGYLAGGALGGFDQQPWTCLPGASGPGNTENVSPPGTVANEQLPFCYNTNVNVHHNSVTRNSSIGDELFSGTPAGAGGVTFCAGADYYKFNYNWVCGNLSTGDGGGLSHLGYIWNGDIEHNQFLFNQSTNPTIATNGGGIVIMGAAPDGTPPGAAAGTECGSVTDVDCAPGLPDGTGPNLVINANLIMGNAADSGSGGGLRLQSVNGTEVSFFPSNPSRWNNVSVTNNIIANNVAGWDGAGISLQDALDVNIINNTIISNDSTASSGVLFNTIGAPLASAPGSSNTTSSTTTSAPQPAGLVVVPNSSNLTATFAGLTITCPAGHGVGGTGPGGLRNASCREISYPELYNDVFWQNRSFYIGVGALSASFQQNIVELYNAVSHTPAVTQPPADAITGNGNGAIITGGTGACGKGATYWDIGVRGDSGPGNHSSAPTAALVPAYTLRPMYSVMTNASETPAGQGDLLANPTAVQQYCNGARIPPEFGGTGFQVPPGISDAQVPNPIFSLIANATVDEGNNWINISWGPLAEANPVTGATLGNYSLAVGSPAIDYIPTSASTYDAAPSTDFFGNPRPDVRRTAIDVGAVEFQHASAALAFVTPTELDFGAVDVGTPSAAQTLTVNAGGAALTGGITVAFPAGSPFSRSGGTCGVGTLAAGNTCTIIVVFTPTTAAPASSTVTITSSRTIDGSPVTLTGTGQIPSFTASVTPSPLAFGNSATGVGSAQTLTVTNTGNSALAGGTFTFSAATPFTRAGGTCGATLALGATCTINVVFTPTASSPYNGSLAVAYTGATVTGSPVALTGTGVAAASVSIAPNPLTITIATPFGNGGSGTGTVTFTNTATGGASVTVTAVGVASGTGSGMFTWIFNKIAGTGTGGDTCTGKTLAPGASCTVGVRFTNVTSPVGVNRAGTITFTDTGAGGSQTGALVGHANP